MRPSSLVLAALSLAVPLFPLSGHAQEAVELPQIDVTTPSPVVKPSKTPTKSSGTSSSSAVGVPGTEAEGAAVTSPSAAAFAVPPGTVVADDAFVSVTVATEREIAATRGATVTETLQTKPGIVGSTFAPGANRPIIRGLDNYRVRVQEDGIGTHDVSALSEDHLVPIDPYSADRIEVVRGPATLRYGSQAIGGVVAVENERVPTHLPQGGFSGGLKGGTSSVDEGRDSAFEATGGSGGFVVHADGFWREADDYDTPRGTEANTFVDAKGGSFGTSLVGADGFLGVALAHIESDYGVPAEESHIELEQDKVLARGEWRTGASTIDAMRFWFGASDYAHDEVAEDGAVGSRFTNEEQEARLEIQHSPTVTSLGTLNGAMGAQWGHRDIEAQSFEGDSLLAPAETDMIAGFWFEEIDMTTKLRLQAAARIEHTNVDGIGLADISDPTLPVFFNGERSFTPVSASAGLLYELPLGVVARLTGQYVERAPDAAELFSKGVHEATGTFELGNPFLETEKARTIELGLKRARGSLRFDTSAYYTVFDGFIFKELSGRAEDGAGCGDTLATCGSGTALDLLRFGQRDATFYGSEVAAELDVAPIWRGLWGVDAQYDFVHAEFDGGENVQRIPPQRAGGGLYYRDPSWYLRAGVLHAFRQDEIGINETPTGSYSLVSAEISYTVTKEEGSAVVPQLTVGLKGENLADDDVRNHASFKKDEVLLPGASVRVFAIIKLN
jgi:iron complex outermembrane receptor protein